MPSAKEEVRELLERLPDEASFDEIEYRIYMLHEIRQGIAEGDRGKLFVRAHASKKAAPPNFSLQLSGRLFSDNLTCRVTTTYICRTEWSY